MADETNTASAVQPKRVNVRNEQGETISVAASDLADAKAKGWHPETDQEFYHRKREEKYGGIGGTIAAGAAGVARGLTLGGLSDVALTKLGIVDPETLTALKEVHPVASTVGEIGGTVGGALATGGASAAGAGVRIGAKAGGFAEKMLAKAVREGALARLAAKATGAAAESGLYGVGQVASEDALGEHDLTAEHLLSTVGMSALMGGKIAAGLHGAGGTIKAAIKGTRTLTEKAAEAYGKIANKLGSAADAETMRAAVTGGDGTFSGTLSGPKWDITPEGREQIARDLSDSLQHVHETASTIGKQASGARPKEVRQILEGAEDTGIAHQRASELGEHVKGVAEDMIEKAANGDFDQSTGKRISSYVDGFADAINKPGTTHADVFDAANELKRKLADEAEFGLRFDQLAEKKHGDRKSIEAARDLYKQVQNHLEDSGIYGEAASRQASYNRATADFIGAQKQFMRNFGTGGEIDPVKINTYLNQIGTMRGARRENALASYLDKAVGYIGEAGKTLHATGNALDDIGALNKISQVTMHKTRAIEALGQIAKMRALGFGMPLLGEPTRLIEGAIHMEPQTITAMAVKAAKTLVSPAGTVKVLGSINRASRIAQERIIGGVDKLLVTRTGKALGRLPPVLGSEVADKGTGNEIPAKTPDRGTIQQRAIEIKEAASDPARLQNIVASSVAGLDQFAPKLAGHVAAAHTRALLFLASKAPVPAIDPLQPNLKRTEPHAKLASFARYLAAVKNPHSILDDARAGKLSAEAVEAVRAVYPRMYGQMVEAMTQRIAQRTEPLPHTQRSRINRLLGVPLEPLNNPQNLAILRAAATAGGQKIAAEQAAQAPRQRSLNSSKLKFAGDSATTQQRLMGG